jgi:hypothetical protein
MKKAHADEFSLARVESAQIGKLLAEKSKNKKAEQRVAAPL